MVVMVNFCDNIRRYQPDTKSNIADEFQCRGGPARPSIVCVAFRPIKKDFPHEAHVGGGTIPTNHDFGFCIRRGVPCTPARGMLKYSPDRNTYLPYKSHTMLKMPLPFFLLKSRPEWGWAHGEGKCGLRL